LTENPGRHVTCADRIETAIKKRNDPVPTCEPEHVVPIEAVSDPSPESLGCAISNMDVGCVEEKLDLRAKAA
jgi:hypothetical protein